MFSKSILWPELRTMAVWQERWEVWAWPPKRQLPRCLVASVQNVFVCLLWCTFWGVDQDNWFSVMFLVSFLLWFLHLLHVQPHCALRLRGLIYFGSNSIVGAAKNFNLRFFRFLLRSVPSKYVCLGWSRCDCQSSGVGLGIRYVRYLPNAPLQKLPPESFRKKTPSSSVPGNKSEKAAIWANHLCLTP